MDALSLTRSMKSRQCQARAAFAKEKINHAEQLKDVPGSSLGGFARRRRAIKVLK